MLSEHEVFSQSVCYGSFESDLIGIQSVSCDYSSVAWENRYKLQTSFIPNSNTPIKYVSLRFKISQYQSGDLRNFDCNNQDHIDFLHGIVSTMNTVMSNIPSPSDPWASVCGTCHISDSKIRFVLKGIDCSIIGNDYNDIEIIPNVNEFTNPFSEINIFMRGLKPDYIVSGRAIGGPFNSFGDIYEESDYNHLNYGVYLRTINYYRNYTHGDGSDIVSNLLHELGHGMGLAHTYYNPPNIPQVSTPSAETCDHNHPDYLSDLYGPTSPSNCWEPYKFSNTTPPDPNALCDPFDAVEDYCSNNFMSWKGYYLTPRQLGRIHRNSMLTRFRNYVCGSSSTFHEVSSDETWDFDIKMYNNIRVTNNAKLTISCKVSMPENAKILVEKGSELIIDGGTITASDCNTGLWSGIEIEGDNSLNQFGTGNQGKLTVKNEALIEHADVAVSVWKRNEYNTTGGIINVSNSTFRNNRTSIVFKSYQNTNQITGLPFRNLSSITNNTFEITADYKSSFYSLGSQISMWDVHGIHIIGNTFINHVPHLFTIRGIGVGLLSSSSNIKDNNFKGLHWGVSAISIGSNPKVQIKGNVFEENAFGVGVLDHDFVLIQNNLFESNSSAGSDIFASMGFELTENTFKNHPMFGSLFAYLGSFANESYKNYYEDNTIGTSSHELYHNSTMELVYKCNEFDDPHSHYNIHVDSPGKITTVQGNCIDPPRNKFSHTCNFTSSDFEVSQDHPGQVWYPSYLNPIDPRYNLSCYSTTKVNEFNCEFQTPDFSCPSISTTQNSSLSTISILIGAISSKKGELGDVKDERYVLVDGGQGNSLLDLVEDISETSGSIRDAIADVAPYASIEVLQACLDKSPSFFSQRELYEILKFNSPLPNSIREQENTYNDRIGSSYGDSLSALQIGNSLVDSLNAEVVFAETEVDLAISKAINQMLHDTNHLSSIEDIIDVMKGSDKVEMKIPLLRAYWEAENWGEASNVLDDLSEVSEYEEIHNVLSQMHDEKSEGRNPSLLYVDNEDFRNDIHNLASDTSKIGCWFARGLTTVFTDSIFMVYIDSIELPLYGKKDMLSEMELKDTESSPYSIYPNPAQNWITITGGEGAKKNYRITSLDGKLVLEGTLPSGNTESRIDLKHISSGVYLITLMEEKGASFTHKIVIK